MKLFSKLAYILTASLSFKAVQQVRYISKQAAWLRLLRVGFLTGADGVDGLARQGIVTFVPQFSWLNLTAAAG
jgi:hypothetical protein